MGTERRGEDPHGADPRPKIRVTKDRGRTLDTPHAPTDEQRRAAMAQFVADLKAIARHLANTGL